MDAFNCAFVEKSVLENFESPGFGQNLGKYRYILLVDSMLYVSCPDPLVDARPTDLIVGGGWAWRYIHSQFILSGWNSIGSSYSTIQEFMLGWLVLHTQTNSISYLLDKDTTTDKTATIFMTQ